VTTEEGGRAHRDTDWRELVAVVLLSLTAVLTAWTGFQASKWGGAMSISFAQASTARIEAARLDGTANQRQSVQVGLFTQWLQARTDGKTDLADFLSTRFPEPLATAFATWLASHPLTNEDAAASPFSLPEYALPERAAGAAADARADAKFAQALRNNQRGDNYTVLTVAYAMILFFGALSGRMRDPRSQWGLLGLAALGFVVCGIVVLSFPTLV
jgi:hypothetical protein